MAGSKINGSESPVPSPSPETPEFQRNGLNVEGPPFGLESIYDYTAGGHYLVHLGDAFNDGRHLILLDYWTAGRAYLGTRLDYWTGLLD